MSTTTVTDALFDSPQNEIEFSAEANGLTGELLFTDTSGGWVQVDALTLANLKAVLMLVDNGENFTTTDERFQLSNTQVETIVEAAIASGNMQLGDA